MWCYGFGPVAETGHYWENAAKFKPLTNVDFSVLINVHQVLYSIFTYTLDFKIILKQKASFFFLKKNQYTRYEVIKLVNELGSPFCITYLKYLSLASYYSMAHDIILH